MPTNADASNPSFTPVLEIGLSLLAEGIIMHYHDYPAQTYFYNANNLLIALIDYVPYEPPCSNGSLRESDDKTKYIRFFWNQREHKTLITSINMGSTRVLLLGDNSVRIY